MQVEYTLNEGDLVALHKHHLATSRGVSRGHRRTHVVVVGLMLVVLVFLQLGKPVDLGRDAGALVLALLAYAIASGGYRFFAERLVLRAIVREGGKQPRTLFVIDPSGVRWSSAQGDGSSAWSTITRIDQLPSLLALTTTDERVLGVPRRAFESDASAEAFEREARALWEQARPHDEGTSTAQ